MLKIYYLSSEIMPFSDSDSTSSFSKEFSITLQNQCQKEIDIRLTQPKYGYISDRRYILREVIRLKELSIDFLNKNNIINLKSGFIPNTRVQVYFMEHKKYFDNVCDLLYKSRNGRFYSDNHEKFTFFVKAAIETLKKLYWIPDYIVCNNWQMSMLPQMFNTFYKNEFQNTKIIYMIHSINDLYDYDNSFYKKIGLEPEKNKKKQNNIINAIKHSDYIYAFNDSDNKVANYMKKSNVKSVLKKKKYSLINYSSNMETSERIQVYNSILRDLKKT